jgi:hypothetical protein
LGQYCTKNPFWHSQALSGNARAMRQGAWRRSER